MQVRTDYLRKKFESLDLDVAIQLCCIEIRRFFKDMPQVSSIKILDSNEKVFINLLYFQVALDKKSNFEYLEKEVGLQKFLPRFAIESQKPKALRKLIQQHFKKYAGLTERECMCKFFEILKSIYRFDQERFKCALGVSQINFSTNFQKKVFGLENLGRAKKKN